MTQGIKINLSEKLLRALHGDNFEAPKENVEISSELKNELTKIANAPLDLEKLAQIEGQFKPLKKAISIRMDVDLLEWFQAQPGKYQKLINKACRIYKSMQEEAHCYIRESGKSV